MQKLLSQSKHEEFESNSALQIRDQKERRVENAKKLELKENFRRLHCSSCEIFILQHCSPFFHYSPFLLFDAVTFLLQFFVSSHFIPCISFLFCFFFCNFLCSEQYISLSQALYKSITSCNKFLAGEAFTLPPLFSASLSLIFFPFSRQPNTLQG